MRRDVPSPSVKPVVLLILFLHPTVAFCWTRNGDQRIARVSAELAPRDLRLVLQRLDKSYVNGVDRARAEESTDMHRALLRQRIEKETQLAIQLIRTNQPMTAVAERLGMIAHLVGDANNPFHMNDEAAADPAHADFEDYFERRMQLFPTVSYGINRNLELGPYLKQMFERTEKLLPLMNEEYSRGGERHTSMEFDDRSTAFGVASICYSHAVTDLVNLYYYIWRQAGGDVRATR